MRNLLLNVCAFAVVLGWVVRAHATPPGATFVDSRERSIAKASVSSLLVPEFRRDTLALCAAFFFCRQYSR